MDKLTEIYAGWKNYVFPNEQVEKEAKRRMEICVDCFKFKTNNNFCQACGCYMPAKVRSLKSRCPLRKWS